MRKILLFLVSLSLLLSACGKEPLKFRNLLEADQYLRNNVPKMQWNEFKALLDSDHQVSEEEFQNLKKILSTKYSSSHSEVDNKLYRFNEKQKLMYMTQWDITERNLFYLKEINFITE